MPYKLEKGKSGYWVVSVHGRHMSKKELPIDRAKAQMRALYLNVHDSKKK